MKLVDHIVLREKAPTLTEMDASVFSMVFLKRFLANLPFIPEHTRQGSVSTHSWQATNKQLPKTSTAETQLRRSFRMNSVPAVYRR